MKPFETLALSNPETLEHRNPGTFVSWYEPQHQSLTQSGETAKARLLENSYHKTLQYQIFQTSLGYEFSEPSLILQCHRLYEYFCWQLRI